jgi:hypothetical protein
VNRSYPTLRADEGSVRLPFRLGQSHPVRPACLTKWTVVQNRILRAARILFPSLLTLSLTMVAHAQGTMDFSGAQTLMGTFKTFAAFVRRAEEGTLTRLLVESTILLAASRGNPSAVLKDSANAYKVDTDAIAAKVKQEFAAKDKAKKTAQTATRGEKKVAQQWLHREGRHFASPLCCPKIAAGRTRAGFSLHPHPAASPRSPAARQEDVPPSCTFPLTACGAPTSENCVSWD